MIDMTFNKMEYIQIDEVYDILPHVLSLQVFFLILIEH